MAKLKQFLREAKAYAEMKTRLQSSGVNSGAARDAAMEAMVPVMRRESGLICPADHFRDIRAAVEIGDEFGVAVIIAGAAASFVLAS